MDFPRHQSALVLASVLTVFSFLAAAAYTEYRLTALDTLSSTIATNAVPSIEYLGRGGIRLKRVRELLGEAIAEDPARSHSVRSARAALDALNDDVARYLQLTPLPGEHELWTAMRGDIGRAVNAAHLVLNTRESGETARAAVLLRTDAEPAFERAGRTMLAAMEFDVGQSERLAREVRTVRRATTWNIVILDVLATVVAAATALIAVRAARDHDRLVERHSALLDQRVAELDRFAGRVAHDVLNPLSVVGFALARVSRSADADLRRHVERGERAVQRVQQLVEGLLRFARSGAEISSDARCEAGPVLETVAQDCAEAAKSSGIEVAVLPSDRLEVACSVGVLTSIVQNLVSNAIKYMGDRPTRRVSVRATRLDGRARFEVADTGPGIPPDIQNRIFDAFVRGAHGDVGGIGLGLATVKRLAEAHRGAVGVQSTPGAGSVFWVELPLAANESGDVVV